MDIKVGDWGLYPWFPEHGAGFVHPEDLRRFQDLFPYGKLFECVAHETDYVVLRYDGKCFRVKSSLFQPKPRPKKVFGEAVAFVRNGDEESGVVRDIIWHFQKCIPFFLVSVGSKRLPKRYWAGDFK